MAHAQWTLCRPATCRSGRGIPLCRTWKATRYAGTRVPSPTRVSAHAGPPHARQLVGRGACDMKAGVSAALHVFAAFAALPDRDFAGEVVFAAVAGEEDGGVGCLAALQRGLSADACIIPEPTGGASAGGAAGPAVVVAHAGSVTLTLEVEGRSAHASSRLDGVSALDKYFVVHEARAAPRNVAPPSRCPAAR